MSGRGKHPDEALLALLAGGDLPLLSRVRLSWHTGKCPACSAVVESYRRQMAAIPRLADEMDEGEWTRLEAEMRANIHLGLAAGEALPHGREADEAGFAWRWAVVAASMVFVFGAGVWMDRQPAGPAREMAAAPAQPMVEAGRQGLSLRGTDSSLELMRPAGSEAVRTASWDVSARARYFDGETGQVTIHQVAWEENDAQ